MAKSRFVLLTLALVFSISGCFRTSFVRRDQRPGSLAIDGEWNHNAILGLVNFSGDRDLSQICPRGWERIEVRTTFLNGLVTYLIRGGQAAAQAYVSPYIPTVNLYSPQSVSVRCGATSGAASDPGAATLSAEQEKRSAEAVAVLIGAQ